MQKSSSRLFPIGHIDLNIKLYFISPCIIFLILTMRTSEEKYPSNYRYNIICDRRKDGYSGSQIRPVEVCCQVFLLQVGSLLYQFMCLNSISNNLCGTGLCFSCCHSLHRVTAVTLDNVTSCVNATKYYRTSKGS